MKYLVAVYDCAQQYGGPEEGGWWYDSGTLVKIVKVFTHQELAYMYCRDLNNKLHSRVFGPNKDKPSYTSAISRGEIRAEVYENTAPSHYPETKPHYE